MHMNINPQKLIAPMSIIKSISSPQQYGLGSQGEQTIYYDYTTNLSDKLQKWINSLEFWINVTFEFKRT